MLKKNWMRAGDINVNKVNKIYLFVLLGILVSVRIEGSSLLYYYTMFFYSSKKEN